MYDIEDEKSMFHTVILRAKGYVYAVKNVDVKNKLNTLFLILLAGMLPFDLPFDIFVEHLMLLIIV